MDKISKEKRSGNMSRIRTGNTKPELIVRSLLHRMGYRFRLHRKDLPGKPDIVLPKETIIDPIMTLVSLFINEDPNSKKIKKRLINC